MLDPAIRTLAATSVALLLAVAPAAADPGTTGGVPADKPLVLSPEGGLDGPSAGPDAAAAKAGDEPSGSDHPAATTTPPTPARESTSGEGGATAEAPHAQASSRPSPTATDPASTGGGGLPRTGFVVAALVALGTGFFLTGYALRYSRTLDG